MEFGPLQCTGKVTDTNHESRRHDLCSRPVRAVLDFVTRLA